MQLTDEQLLIINSNKNIKINAVAGSGKTTTLIEYARTRPKNKKILYIAFNKSVRLEAEKKFKQLGLYNVEVKTAHGLALKHTRRRGFQIKEYGYKPFDLKSLLKLHRPDGMNSDFILASHILACSSLFCNSNVEKFEDLDYLASIKDGKSRGFAKKHIELINKKTYEFLGKMWKAEIPVEHDFYLKLFQLSKPTLPHDYILFDEGQDASPAMLDVFLRQENAIKVMVGDQHQQIYSWRYAVNALEQVPYPTFWLTKSFRFHSGVAKLAKQILGWKTYIDGLPCEPEIEGLGENTAVENRAVLARTNVSLLRRAIDMVSNSPEEDKIYFEGNLNNYTFAKSASLYDVFFLFLEQNEKIQNPVLKDMADMEELKDYAKEAGDPELAMLIEIVEEYGKKTLAMIKRVKERNLDEAHRDEAKWIFSTVHKSKGMEYDEVILEDDFIKESELIKLEDKKTPIDIKTRNDSIEEINLLYVAVTRSKHILHLPGGLLEGVQSFKHVKIDRRKTGNPSLSRELRSKKREDSWEKNADDDFAAFLKKKGI